MRIARELSAEYGLRVCPMTVSHWINGNRKPAIMNIFRDEASPQLSYIIGAALGDGCSLEKSGCVKLEVTDKDFAQVFNSSMARLFNREVSNKIFVRRFEGDRLPLFVVKHNSKQLTNLLRLPMKKLLDLAFAFPREFLRGFFDAEGHVDVSATDYFSVIAGVENLNKLLLLRIKKILLAAFGINSSVSLKRRSGTVKTIRAKSFRMRKSSFTLRICRLRDLQEFRQRIGFSISRKNEKLSDALLTSERYGRNERSTQWRQEYIKIRGEWIRRRLSSLIPIKGIKEG